jgi:hypothetical protein
MSAPFIPHVGRYAVEISDGIATLRTRSGGESIEQAMSVKTVEALRATLKRALERYAAGEQNVIEGED